MAARFEYTSIEEALSVLSRSLGQKARRERLDVRDAYGRVLAADVLAREDLPKKDASHFDGFAVASDDTLSASRDSPVDFALRPKAPLVGLFPSERLDRGQAMKVATGGYLPAGADAVVPLEDARVRGDEVQVSRRVERGDHVFPAGSDVKKGDLLLRAGTELRGQHLVLLASLHVERVLAFARPSVAVIPTGSELTSDIADRKTGKVVESHGLLLTHLVQGAGGQAVALPIVPDEKRALSSALKDALRRCDISFTLAGSSVGEPDLVESTLRGFGESTTAMVHGIKVHRGRVMGFAVVDRKPIVILPGPIQGALNAFIVLGYPLIRYYLGRGLEQPPSVPATVGEDWEASGKFKGFDQVVYLRLKKDTEDTAGGLLAMPSSGETEKVSFLVSKNAYALVSGTRPRLSKGERIQAHLLPGFSGLE